MAAATLLPRSPVRQAGVGSRAATQFSVGSHCPAPGLDQGQSLSVPGISRHIQVKIASTFSEWQQAFQLVADNYQARGFEAGNAACRFTSYHALPQAVVLVAKEGAQVVATLSLFPDNPLLGLPLESLYRAELDTIRQQGRRLFEGGCLADRKLTPREFLQVFLTLMQVAWQQQLSRGADTNVIVVNPRHRSFYTKAMGYLPFGMRRSYDHVQGHPAEAFYADRQLMQVRAPKMHRRMFVERVPAGVLQAPRMPARLTLHFARHSSQTNPETVERILGHVGDGTRGGAE